MILWALLAALPQIVVFQTYLDSAGRRLGIQPPRVRVSSERPWASWIPYGPGASQAVVYARLDFLRDSDPRTMEIVATHECCHIYLGTNKRLFIQGEEDLHHMMIDKCIEWVLGTRYDSVMREVPCGYWYPNEVLRYNRRTGRGRCVEKR